MADSDIESLDHTGARWGQLLASESLRLLEALARVNEIGARINRLSRGDRAGVAAALHLIAESAILVVPGSAAVIYAYDAARQAFDPVSRASAGPSGRAEALAGDVPRAGGMGERALQQRRTVLSYEELDLDVHPSWRLGGAKVAACLPLIVADDPVGALYIFLQDERRLAELELLLLSNFVNLAAMAIHHASRYYDVQRDLARKVDELALLRHAGLLISSRSGLKETLEAILQMALEITNARYGIFRLVDRQGHSLVAHAIAGEDLGRPAVEALPLNTTSVMGWVAKTRTPLSIADVRNPPWSRIYYPLDHALEMRSELAVPLIGAGGHLEGVLNLESPEVSAFDEDDNHLLQALATQAVIAIQEVRLLDALREMAERLLEQPLKQAKDRLLELACDLLNAQAGAIWVAADDYMTLSSGLPEGCFPQQVPAGASLAGEASRAVAPFAVRIAMHPSGGELVEDLGDAERSSRAERGRMAADLPTGSGWSHALLSPLSGVPGSSPVPPSGQAPVGALGIYRREGAFAAPSFSDWDRKVLSLLAHFAALALQNAARQEALRAALEAHGLAETFAAMGDIAANLLHHLNNKVGTIPVRVEGIQDKCAPALGADPYLAANLAQIEQSALDAMQTVRDHLSLLRPMETEAVSVGDAVEGALALAHLPPGITMVTQGLEELPTSLASRQGLVLVIGNLLDNAVEATDGAGRITISGLAERGWVEISVCDSGRGILPDDQARIFDFSFSRGRAAQESPGPNARPAKLGFGLWWVKTLMSRLGGAVSVESDGERGAIFRLRLPAREREP